jgi:triosephosphate isomerase
VRKLVFAANWKMHIGPHEAREFLTAFRHHYQRHEGRAIWFFPPAVSIESVAHALGERSDLLVGAQNIYWQPKGAFTGETSAPLASHAGAKAVLIGHSERRHVFGESDADTRKKVEAALGASLIPMLCVGETLAEREAGTTLDVVRRQLNGALEPLDGQTLDSVLIAYEPVWAIGTGRNASPADAAQVHGEIRAWLKGRGSRQPRVLYGGSVNLKNIADLLAESELDGVLVGGASLEAAGWAQLVSTATA